MTSISGVTPGGAYIGFNPRHTHNYLGSTLKTTFSASFTNFPGYIQRIGYFNPSNIIMIGRNFDGQFGIYQAEGGKIHIETFTVTTAATAAGTATVTLNGIPYTVSLTNASGDTSFTAYQICNGNNWANQWICHTINNVITFTATSAGVRTAGSYTPGTTGSVVTTSVTQSGVDLVSSWTYTSSFNKDPNYASGLDYSQFHIFTMHTSGNTNLQFELFIYDSTIRENRLLHSTFKNEWNTSMRFRIENINAGVPGVSQDLLCTGFGQYYTVLPQELTGVTRSFSTEVSIPANTETNIISALALTSINGFFNTVYYYPKQLSIATDGTKSVVVKIKGFPTLGNNTPSNFPLYTSYTPFVSINTNPNTVSANPLTVDGSTLYLSKTDSVLIRYPPFDFGAAGSQVPTAISAFSSGASTVSISFDWVEFY